MTSHMTTGTCQRCRYAVLEAFPSCPGCSRRLRHAGDRNADTEPLVTVDVLDGWRPTEHVVDAPQPVALLPLDAVTSVALAAISVAGCLLAVSAAVDALLTAAGLWPVLGVGASAEATLRGAHRSIGLAALATAPFALAALAAWTGVATANLARLGIEHRRFRAATAVVAWMVPGVNLVLAKLTVDDLWRGSSARVAPHPGKGWRRRPVGEVVHLWWLALVGTPLLTVAGHELAAGDTAAQAQVGLAASAAAAVLALTLLSATRRVLASVAGSQLLRSHVVASALASPQAHATVPTITLADLSDWTT